MENPYQSVGKRVRYFRKQNKISQAELAEKANLSDNYIGLIERGLKQPPLTTLSSIAKALDVELSVFFSEGKTPNGDQEATAELKKLLAKKNFKDAQLLLAIYKTIRSFSSPPL